MTIPLLALFYDLKFIVPVVCIFELMLSVLLVPRVFRDVDRRCFAYMVGGAVFGSVAGILLLDGLSNTLLKRMLGLVIIAVAFTLLRERPARTTAVSDKWGLLSGLAGGVLGGMFGTSGPPFVSFLAWKGVAKHVFRATLIAVFAMEDSWRMALLLHQGICGIEELRFALALAPALILATLLGHKAHGHMGEVLFRRMIFGLLLGSGILCLVQG